MLFTLNCSLALTLSPIRWLALYRSRFRLLSFWRESRLAVRSGFSCVSKRIIFHPCHSDAIGADICCMCTYCVAWVCTIRFFPSVSSFYFIFFSCRYYSGKQQQCYSILINILRWDDFFLPDSSQVNGVCCSRSWFFISIPSSSSSFFHFAPTVYFQRLSRTNRNCCNRK